MYDNQLARPRAAHSSVLVAVIRSALVIGIMMAGLSALWAQEFQSASVIRKISGRSEKLELTTNTSRILTLEKNIPRVQVNNPDLVTVTPLSATDVQISAKKAGVTQINLWDEDGNIHTVDVLIYGDVRELEVALQTQFPNSSIRVFRYSESLILKGIIDQPEHVTPIMRIAEDYAPKVINNMSVGGAQQVLLKVRIMEVSRTGLRRIGLDAHVVASSVSATMTIPDFFPPQGASIGLVGHDFISLISLLQERGVAKIMAEPNLIAISGRPAKFNVGGKAAYVAGVGIGQVQIGWEEFGTRVDFVPIVLGNGTIRLEVRPSVSSVDDRLGIRAGDTVVPGFAERMVETAVEMKAGQTFALAGLIQERTETINRGLPFLVDVPYLGAPFRKVQTQTEEIELLILVTPEFVDPMDPHEAPCIGPGYVTVEPTHQQLFWHGHVEVPPHCNPIRGPLACGVDPCGPCAACQSCAPGGHAAVITDGLSMPGGVGYDDGPSMMMPPQPREMPDDLPLPPEASHHNAPLPAKSYLMPQPTSDGQSSTTPAHIPPRQPTFMRNASSPHNPQPHNPPPSSRTGDSGFIGPIGYDVQ